MSDTLFDKSRRNLFVVGAGASAVLGLMALPGSANAADKPAPATLGGKLTANSLTTRDGTVLYYKDWGTGPAVVFSHGYPLSSDAWDYQMLFLSQHGYCVIAHDRRGFGRGAWRGIPGGPG